MKLLYGLLRACIRMLVVDKIKKDILGLYDTQRNRYRLWGSDYPHPLGVYINLRLSLEVFFIKILSLLIFSWK